ncbi:MAG: glycosyl transferase family 1 [candidate division GAL15 bacterium]
MNGPRVGQLAGNGWPLRQPLVAALISTYPPRECGIATFTRDLSRALRDVGIRTWVVAMDEEGAGYAYGPEVRLQIHEDAPEEYRAAAEVLNRSDAHVVNLQHEFGIFGGEWGEHVLELVEGLDRPLVVTLHTVLPDPPPRARKVVRTLCRRAAAVVVMSPSAVDLLEARYGVPRSRVHVIGHGVPTVEPVPREEAKRRLGLHGRLVVSTFGLVSPGKGIEDVLEALPAVVERHPEALYLVLGETHPNVRRREGERYRNVLLDRVRTLQLSKHVRFENRYLRDEEILAYLQATDVYVTPYQNPDQIVSGTLSWALAAGCAVVSTPYRYAVEVLSDGRGVLVPFRDPQALARALDELLADPGRRARLGERAYVASLPMRWPRVAARYAAVFEQAVDRAAAEAAV